jgi:hypothetical protein
MGVGPHQFRVGAVLLTNGCHMLGAALECRRFAEECLSIAERVGPKDADMLRGMAAIWLRVATEAMSRTSRESSQRAMNKQRNGT